MNVTTDESARLDAPSKRTATLGSGQAIMLILSIHTSCSAADTGIRPVVSLDLRYDDGTTGRTVIQPLDGYQAGFGQPHKGWVAVTVAQACARS